jgi:rhamnose transport system permease protein
MAILGGASPSGGKGRVGGVVLGVFTIGMIRYGTGIINVSAETLKIIIGLLLIVVCAIPNLREIYADMKEAKRGRSAA